MIKFTNLLLYGNFWIAASALALGLQTQYLLSGQFHLDTFSGFLFFSTLFIYAMHRIVGLEKVKPFQDHGRYQVIAQYKNHILIYAGIGMLLACWFFWQLPFKFHWLLILPCFISLGYVFPVLTGKRRLRDLSFIKIFLIAIVWAWITVVLAAKNIKMIHNIPMIIMALERACFVFAITLPFDIRDLEVDRFSKVKTLPTILGVKKTKWLAGISILLMLLLSSLNYRIDAYSINNLVALILSGVSTFALIYFSDRFKQDYYFTGILDGTMILQFLLLLLI